MSGYEDPLPKKSGVVVSHTKDIGWHCDNCGRHALRQKHRMTLTAKFIDPLFDRRIDFCTPCAIVTAKKLKQIVDLFESEDRGNGESTKTSSP